MTPFFSCKKAEVLLPKPADPIRASVSTDSAGGLLISVPREAECPLRAPVDIRFYDPILGVVRCRCRLSSPLVSGETRSFRCKVLERMAQIQRREDIKVPLSIMVYADYEGTRYPANVENISAGGVYLVSGLVAAVGDQLNFIFPKTDPPIPLTARILRAELRVNQNGRSAYGYGCRFVDLNVSNESLLRAFVFQAERQLYHPSQN